MKKNKNTNITVSADEPRREKKKLTVPSELAYLVAIVMLAFSIALQAISDFGVSMIVAPAYVLSRKIPFLTFGLAEYAVEGLLLIVFCICMRKVRAVWLTSLLTTVIHGAVLDGWRALVPFLNEDVTPPGSLPLWESILLFAAAIILTAFAIAIAFRVYLYPEVYDLFVKGLSKHFGVHRIHFKIVYDLASLVVAVALSLILFGDLVGIGVGTVVLAFINGTAIGLAGKILDCTVVFRPLLPRLAAYMETSEEK